MEVINEGFIKINVDARIEEKESECETLDEVISYRKRNDSLVTAFGESIIKKTCKRLIEFYQENLFRIMNHFYKKDQ